MKPEKILLFIVLFLLCVLLGCTSHEKYSYESIQKEYAHLACNTGESPQEKNDLKTCEINRVLSLADAVRIALKNNPEQKMAAARIRQSQAMLSQSDAAFFPALGFYTEYTHADAPSVYLFKTIDQRALPPGTDFNDPGTVKNFETGINARMNLYNGGRDILNRKMAETGLGISNLDKEIVENSLVASVIRAYYDALAAEDFIKIARESVSTVKKQLKIMKIRLKGGSALKSDILSLEVRLARSLEEEVRASNRYKTSVNALANILGIDTNVNIKLQKSNFKLHNIPRQYHKGMEYSKKNRAEFAKARQQVRLSRMGIDSAKSQFLPRVDLQARYYLDDKDLGYDTDLDNWMAAIVLNWDIFTGFSTKAAINKAEAILEQTLAADRNAELSLKLDVKNAYLNLEAAAARLKVAKTSVASADESLSIVKKQYDGGSVSITRYLEAELDRNRAKIRATAAFYDQEKSIADIGRAVGYWGKTKQIK